jgi:hypothetical protein
VSGNSEDCEDTNGDDVNIRAGLELGGEDEARLFEGKGSARGKSNSWLLRSSVDSEIRAGNFENLWPIVVKLEGEDGDKVRGETLIGLDEGNAK